MQQQELVTNSNSCGQFSMCDPFIYSLTSIHSATIFCFQAFSLSLGDEQYTIKETMRKNRAPQEFPQLLMSWLPTQETVTVHTFGLKLMVTEEGSIICNAKQTAHSQEGNNKNPEGEGGKSTTCEPIYTLRMSITASGEISKCNQLVLAWLWVHFCGMKQTPNAGEQGRPCKEQGSLLPRNSPIAVRSTHSR